jgi:heterodisulfide reductase subunit A-like polyferredoxin
MREAEVDSELCDGCQDCIEECVYDAIELVRLSTAKRLKARVDPDRCCGCHACAPICPQHGILMNWLGRPLHA